MNLNRWTREHLQHERSTPDGVCELQIPDKRQCKDIRNTPPTDNKRVEARESREPRNTSLESDVCWEEHWFQLRPGVHYTHKLWRENIVWDAKQRSGHLASTANYCKALVLMNVLPQQFWFNCTVKTARSVNQGLRLCNRPPQMCGSEDRIQQPQD